MLQALIRSPTMVNWCMCVIMTFSSSSTDDHSCFLLVPVLHPNRWIYMSPVELSDWSLASGYTSSVHKVNWWGCCSCVFENLARKDHSIVNVNKNSCCRIPVPSPNSGLSTISSPLFRWWMNSPPSYEKLLVSWSWRGCSTVTSKSQNLYFIVPMTRRQWSYFDRQPWKARDSRLMCPSW